MTPEERANEVIDAFIKCNISFDVYPFEERIADEIRLAIAEERESCAKVADQFPLNGHEISNAIRARTPK